MNKIKTFVAYNEQPPSYTIDYSLKEGLDKLKAETDLLMKRHKKWKWTHRERKCK